MIGTAENMFGMKWSQQDLYLYTSRIRYIHMYTAIFHFFFSYHEYTYILDK